MLSTYGKLPSSMKVSKVAHGYWAHLQWPQLIEAHQHKAPHLNDRTTAFQQVLSQGCPHATGTLFGQANSCSSAVMWRSFPGAAYFARSDLGVYEVTLGPQVADHFIFHCTYRSQSL